MKTKQIILGYMPSRFTCSEHSESMTVSDNFLKGQTLLIISPHADDEAYGCAGSVAKIKALGGKVYIMVFSIGDLHQYAGKYKLIKGQTRYSEFVKTAEFLKVDGYDIIFRDSKKHLRLDSIPRRDFVSIIERESSVSLLKIKPTMVALPAISYNQDHCAIFHAGFTATRPIASADNYFPRIVLAYDNPTLFWNIEREKFHPNFYIDISDFLDIKLKALALHHSQLKPG
ncbi:MAG: PIG-L deacetylase family protein, partial [Planctomycetota bacterium]|nr:PIG-L deacetylase family protein [Planctomycetota bacterium]